MTASYNDWESTNPAYLTDGGLEINERVFARVLLQKALKDGEGHWSAEEVEAQKARAAERHKNLEGMIE
jgi:hypothetical protein